MLVILLFYGTIKKEYVKKKKFMWLYLLVLGLLAQAAAAIMDTTITLCMEQYLETFAVFMYVLAVFIQYKNIKK